MIGAWLICTALGAPLTADDVVSAALSRDPALAEAEAAVTAAEGERKGATGLRHDPTLEARLGFGLPQHEAALTQPVSLSGEGIAAARAADASLRAAEADRDRRRLEVAAGARRSMIRAIAADAAVERAGEVLGLSTELRAAAEARLATGDAPELEVHLARLEEAAAAADRVQVLREALAAHEALAATTGIGREAELPDDPMIAAPSGSGSGERSDRTAAAARVERADAALRREKAAALPPLDLGVWAQIQNVATAPGPGGVEVSPWSWSENAAWTVGPTVAVTLPVWSANRAGIARAAGERDLAASELAALEARIDAEQAGSVDRRQVMAAVDGTADPTPEARAALIGVDAALAAGEIGGADAALLRARILDAWRRGSSARASAAEVAVDLALAESWPGLLPGASAR
jgi:outer membrane protein TolC